MTQTDLIKTIHRAIVRLAERNADDEDPSREDILEMILLCMRVPGFIDELIKTAPNPLDAGTIEELRAVERLLSAPRIH